MSSDVKEIKRYRFVNVEELTKFFEDEKLEIPEGEDKKDFLEQLTYLINGLTYFKNPGRISNMIAVFLNDFNQKDIDKILDFPVEIEIEQEVKHNFNGIEVWLPEEDDFDERLEENLRDFDSRKHEEDDVDIEKKLSEFKVVEPDKTFYGDLERNLEESIEREEKAAEDIRHQQSLLTKSVGRVVESVLGKKELEEVYLDLDDDDDYYDEEELEDVEVDPTANIKERMNQRIKQKRESMNFHFDKVAETLKTGHDKARTPYSDTSKALMVISQTGLEYQDSAESSRNPDVIKARVDLKHASIKTAELAETIKPTILKDSGNKDIKVKAKKGFIESLREKSQNNKDRKTQRSLEIAETLDSHAEELFKMYKEKGKELEVDLESIKNKQIRNKLETLRKTTTSEKSTAFIDFKSEIKEEREFQIDSLREALDELQTGKVKQELREKGLSDDEIDKLIYGVKVDTPTKVFDFFGRNLDKKIVNPVLGALGLEKNEVVRLADRNYECMSVDPNGELYISEMRWKCNKLKVEDIKGTDLEEELKRVSAMPKISELTDEEVLQLADSIRIQDGNIRVNPTFLGSKTPGDKAWTKRWIEGSTVTMPKKPEDPENAEQVKKANKDFEKNFVKNKYIPGKRLDYFKNMRGTALYNPYGVKKFQSAMKRLEKPGVYDQILEEVGNLENMSRANELYDQAITIEGALRNNSEKTKNPIKRAMTREELEGIAIKKVEKLKSQGVSIQEITTEKGELEKKLIVENEKKLNLSKVTSIDKKKIEKAEKDDDELDFEWE